MRNIDTAGFALIVITLGLCALFVMFIGFDCNNDPLLGYKAIDMAFAGECQY